jgi:hypothetical protein
METKKLILSVLVVQGLALQAHAWGKSDDSIQKAEVIAAGLEELILEQRVMIESIFLFPCYVLFSRYA